MSDPGDRGEEAQGGEAEAWWRQNFPACLGTPPPDPPASAALPLDPPAPAAAAAVAREIEWREGEEERSRGGEAAGCDLA